MKKSLILLAIIMATSSCSKENDTVEPTPAAIQTPTTYTITKIVLTDFNMTNSSGQPWDATPNIGPDPFVQMVNGGTILFASAPAANVTVSGPHDMSTASVGTIPITLNYDTPTTLEVWENDGNGFTEFVGSAIMQGSYLYSNNNAAEFADVEVVGSNDVRIELSGTFNY